MVEVLRGQIWWADLQADPVGSAPGHRRPVLILQSNALNRSAIDTVIILSITSNLRYAKALGNVLIKAADSGLFRDSVVVVAQIAAIDRTQLFEKVGSIPKHVLRHVEDGVRIALELA